MRMGNGVKKSYLTPFGGMILREVTQMFSMWRFQVLQMCKKFVWGEIVYFHLMTGKRLQCYHLLYITTSWTLCWYWNFDLLLLYLRRVHAAPQQYVNETTELQSWQKQCTNIFIYLHCRFVEKVVIESCASGSKVVFPIVRWMRAKDKLIIQNDSSLPQDDKHLNQRTQELEKKRKLYQLVEKIPGGPLQISELPSDEQFSHDYLVCTAIIYAGWRGH